MILMQSGITHVLNTAEGSEMYHVHINPELYQNLGIKWMGIEATDDEQFELEKFFDKTSEFIEEGLSQKGIHIIVHTIYMYYSHCIKGCCFQGFTFYKFCDLL